MKRLRVTVAVPLAIALTIGALSGCAADWSGAKRLASDQCQVAGQLFPQPGASASAISDADLSTALRPYVPGELAEILEAFAQPTSIAETAGPEEVAATVLVRDRQQRARIVLQEWATLTCGSAIAGEVSVTAAEQDVLPGLSDMQVLRSELDGIPQFAVTGAVDPMNAIAICEAARAEVGSGTRITVVDSDGFPLAQAEAGADCGYDPALLQALAEQNGAATP